MMVDIFLVKLSRITPIWTFLSGKLLRGETVLQSIMKGERSLPAVFADRNYCSAGCYRFQRTVQMRHLYSTAVVVEDFSCAWSDEWTPKLNDFPFPQLTSSLPAIYFARVSECCNMLTES